MVGADGDLAKVRNSSKAVQDILKVLHTPLGSNPLFPQIGSNITISNIGDNINQQFAETRVAASVTQSIQLLQSIQRNQELIQEVTPEEKIVDIAQVTATRDSQDPRQFDIKIVVVTEAQSTVELPSFSLSTTIG